MKPAYYNLLSVSKRPSRKRSLILLVCGVFVTAYIAAAMLWPLQSLQAETVGSAAALEAETIALDWPSYGQSAAFASGYGLLGSDGSDRAVPIASITKIVTALTVLEERPLAEDASGGVVTFTARDVQAYNDYLALDGVVGPVTPGGIISQRDMLDIMLVASANNYADSLAIWAFGSLDAFLTAANHYLTTQGLQNTTIVDATGFSPDNRSTARDLVRLGELALAEPAIARAVDIEMLTVTGIGTFRNTNLLLHADPAVAGIKTGTTDEAGSCLLYAKTFTIDGEQVTVIGATLGAPNHTRLAEAAGQVLATARDGFAEATLARTDNVFATYKTSWGETVDAVAPAEVRGLIWRGERPMTDVHVNDITDYADVPAHIGTVTFRQNQQVVATTPLTLERPLQGPSWWWRLTHPHVLFGG